MEWQWTHGTPDDHRPEDLESAFAGCEVWAETPQNAAAAVRSYLRTQSCVPEMAADTLTVRPADRPETMWVCRFGAEPKAWGCTDPNCPDCGPDICDAEDCEPCGRVE